jgi:hypothetical protein
VVTGAACVVTGGAEVVVAGTAVEVACVVIGAAGFGAGLWCTTFLRCGGGGLGVDAAAVDAVVVVVDECDELEPPQPAAATAPRIVMNSARLIARLQLFIE